MSEIGETYKAEPKPETPEEKCERFCCRTFIEARTNSGQLIKCSCPYQEGELVKEFVNNHIDDIDIPDGNRSNTGHGGYGRYSRYQITQHKYAGGGHPGAGFYAEVLEIHDPPDDRCGFVIYEHHSNTTSESHFSEWETLEDAINAFRKLDICSLPGLKRVVACGPLTPWFYAIGDEQLIGDYAFPDGLQDDPIFRLGEKFIVTKDGVSTVKSCMGTHFMIANMSSGDRYNYRIVYWDDGSLWDSRLSNVSNNPQPVPVRKVNSWLSQAISEFNGLANRSFTIEDGDLRFLVQLKGGADIVGEDDEEEPKGFEGTYALFIKVEAVKSK
jgi:hypothetical protein